MNYNSCLKPLWAMLYVGDKMVDVFVEEDGAIFDVTITL